MTPVTEAEIVQSYGARAAPTVAVQIWSLAYEIAILMVARVRSYIHPIIQLHQSGFQAVPKQTEPDLTVDPALSTKYMTMQHYLWGYTSLNGGGEV